MNIIVLVIFSFCMFLFSVDSLPLLNISVYRPISVVIFSVLFVITLLTGSTKKLSLLDLMLISYFIYSVINSLLRNLERGYLDTNSLIHIVTLTIGVTAYFGAYSSLNILMKNYRKKVAYIIMWSFALPLLVGLLQFINIYIVHLSFVNEITSLFSFRVYGFRVQLISGEPAWATLYLITGVIMLWRWRNELKFCRIILSLMVLAFISMFSFYGLIVILIGTTIYMVLSRNYKAILGLVAIFTIYLISSSLITTFNIGGYFTDRFVIENLNIKNLLENDGSFFVRVVFPLIGMMQFFSSPIFGVGGGMYYLNFTTYLVEYFDYGLKYTEVYYNAFVNVENANPRNLYSRVLSEEGILGAVLFFGFLVGFYKFYCKRNIEKYIFCIMLGMIMNFDSYLFTNMWLILAFIKAGWFAEIKESSNVKESDYIK